MMTRLSDYLKTRRIQDSVYYAVQDSRGNLVLWTTNYSLAEYYAREFARNPLSSEIVIRTRDSRTRR